MSIVVSVAQLVELQSVDLEVAGSIPVAHPNFTDQKLTVTTIVSLYDPAGRSCSAGTLP